MPRSPLYNALWMPHWNGLSTNGQPSGSQGFGIHALPCFDISCHYVEGSKDLGVPVSHGCIRLSNTNAIWFYDNVPIGTAVVVSKS
jgi:lipoprotein-anchoring transpeptidase ErfK/SrfK